MQRYLHWRKQHDRLSQHFRFAKNPIAPSYNEEAIAVHYRQKHLGKQLSLILIAVFAVFSQILKFRLDFISVSVVGCSLYGILAGYWVIIGSLMVAVVLCIL